MSYVRKTTSTHGFTLIEFLVYLGVIGGISIALITFSISILSSKSKTDVVQEVHANARLALETMTRTIRTADSFIVASSTFGSDPGVLVVATDATSTNPTIIELNQDDGRLQITKGTSSAQFVTSERVRVTDLTFTNLTASSTRENVRINLTIEFDGGGDVILQYTRSLRTAVTIRD